VGGYKNNEPVTPDIMEQIAMEEAEAVDANKKRRETSSQMGSSSIYQIQRCSYHYEQLNRLKNLSNLYQNWGILGLVPISGLNVSLNELTVANFKDALVFNSVYITET